MALLASAHADPAPPLWDAELRLGYGLQVSSGDGMTAPRAAPLTVEGLAAFALQDDPLVYAYAGGVVETLDRSAIGASGGVQIESGPMRLRGGAVYFFAPYTLFGATASGGGCHRVAKTMRACADVALTEYFAGTDLVQGHAATQVQLVLGMVFDGN
ncbi:MAG TPA: hypothetical protein VFQ65_25800 [Kofleriaceae bacterium]|nr:hypothetical protein [Kofleriaceae bacterium]